MSKITSRISSLSWIILPVFIVLSFPSAAVDAVPASVGSTLSFQDGVAPAVSYAGTRDTSLSESQPDTAFGASTELFVDGDSPRGSGDDVSSLLRWDISEIQPGSVIESVDITLQVTNRSSGSYGVFAILAPWSETDASWNESEAGANWQLDGARGALDRGTSVLGTVSASAIGSYTFSLNSDGLAVVQAWVDDPNSNHGLIIADASVTDGMDIMSREVAVAAERPKLTISYSGTVPVPVDTDGDGVADAQDVFPEDPAEWSDADGDGTGDNADLDDDNDGMPDVWELQYGFDPLDPTDADGDADGDGISNLQEYLQGSVPIPVGGTLSFQDGVVPAVSYAGTRDTSLSESQPDTAFGASTELFVDGDSPRGSGDDVSSLLRWDISEIQPGSVIESVDITLQVTNRSSGSYGVFAILAPWNETDASWNESEAGANWQLDGARGALDRGTSVLGTVSASAIGSYTFSLNSDGLAVVQAWVDDPNSNHGLIIADASVTDGMDIMSREVAVAAERPKLTISYLGTVPVLVDTDGDGVADAQDVFPEDPAEWSDADGDGTGDNADLDDDNDGMPDVWELQYGFDPLEPTDADGDADGDGISNLQEYLQGSVPIPVGGSLSFQDGVAPAVSYAGTRDTSLSESQPDTAFGASTELFVDGDSPRGSGDDVSSLLRWDISEIQPGSVIESVDITLQVTNRSSGSYGVFAILAPWSETDASWNESEAGANWQLDGARGALDRGTSVLGTVSASAIGSYTFSLNSDGLAVVQAWVDDPNSNHGLIIADASVTDGMDIMSREVAVAAERPKLTISYSGTVPVPVDTDGDGVADAQDVFPADPTEWSDADGDGTGDNADLDDDNDGMPDVWELQYGFDPLDSTDADGDADGDGISNLQEYLQGSVPVKIGLSNWQSSLLQQELSTVTVGEKPQSKVWKHDGEWWLVMPDDSGVYYVWRLDADMWNKILVIDDIAPSAQADTFIHSSQAGIVHILLSASEQTRLVSLEYVPGFPGSYKLWSERPASANVPLAASAEIATLAIDSAGTMWLAADGTTTIEARYSPFPYSSWSADPIVLSEGVSLDDISAITTLAGNSIAVMWSNQVSKRFGFRVHLDGDDPQNWSADEVPASQSASNVGHGMADDHINLAVTSNGVLFAAVKTGFDTSGYTKIALLNRQINGVWDDMYSVDTKGTRPIVVVNEADSFLTIIYSDNEFGGDVLYRESSLDSIKFGSTHKLFTGGLYRNVSSTKDSFIDDLVVITSGAVTDGTVKVDSIRLQR